MSVGGRSAGYLHVVGALLLACIVYSASAAQPHSRADVAAIVMGTKSWLTVQASPRFAPLINYDFVSDPSYMKTVVPYLEARGIDNSDEQIRRVSADLYNLGQALTVMFEANAEAILSAVLPADFMSLFDPQDRAIDHVGRELFGPLPFYLGIMQSTAPQLSLTHVALSAAEYVTPSGDLVFPSTGVIKDLREVDPALSGVTVARIYFREAPRATARCVELFQAATLAGEDPQQDSYMLARMANLYASQDATLYKQIDVQRREGFVGLNGAIPLVSPLSHIALQVADIDAVYAAQRYAEQDDSGWVRPYIDKVSFNPADGSSNAKLLIRSPGKLPLYNTIVEIVHYQTQ